MNHQVYAARTPQDLNILSQQHDDIQITAQLGPKDRKSSASRWNIRHLIAYRLLIKEETTQFIVPIFKTDHQAQCPVCNQDALCSQQLNESAYQSLVGQGPRNLYAKSESELMRLPDGFFWVALSRAARPRANRTSGFPSREKKQVQREGYINSTDAIPGSSSPVSYSSSEFDGGTDTLSELDEDEHYSRRSKPEESTVQLITSFFQYALNLCLVQPLAGLSSRIDVQPRINHEKAVASISGEAFIAAEDDGGICAMLWCFDGWRIVHPYLALLEAKRAFQIVRLDEKTGIHHPITSNEHLAQYLGEAVIAWKGRQELFNHDVFLIAATNTFVSFIHFTFGHDYLEYLDADGVAQWEIIHDEDKDAFVYMSSTKWLNLQSSEGRRVTLCNILALLRWHHSQGSFESGPPPSEPDDDAPDNDAHGESGALFEYDSNESNGSGMETDE